MCTYCVWLYWYSISRENFKNFKSSLLWKILCSNCGVLLQAVGCSDIHREGKGIPRLEREKQESFDLIPTTRRPSIQPLAWGVELGITVVNPSEPPLVLPLLYCSSSIDSKINFSNKDEWKSLDFFPLPLAAGHWGLVEKTVSWRHQDLDLISRPTVMTSQTTGLTTAFGFLGERCYLNARFLILRVLCAAIKRVFLFCVKGEWVRKWGGARGNWGREGSQFSSSSDLKDISIQITPSVQWRHAGV